MRYHVIFGTRPEAVKLCPLILSLRERHRQVRVIATGQQTAMFDELLPLFGITPDVTLHTMRKRESLPLLLSRLFSALSPVLSRVEPGIVIVQGDTASAYAGAVCGFLCGHTVAHVEAGLRSFDLRAPFPEEGFRRGIADVAAVHYATTEAARRNLLAEGIRDGNLLVSGNTVLDALRRFAPKEREPHEKKRLLLTLHRRENRSSFADLLSAVRDIAGQGIEVFYPVHPSGGVAKQAEQILGGLPGVHLSAPLPLPEFYRLLFSADLVLTDSGGVQEECAALSVPCFVLRTSTEREEELENKKITLVGNSGKTLCRRVMKFFSEQEQTGGRGQKSALLSPAESPADRIAEDLIARFSVPYSEKQPPCRGCGWS